MLLIPPGFAQIGIQLRHEADPEPWFVTFGIDLGEAALDLEAVALLCGTAYMGGFGTLHNGETTMDGVQITVGQDGGPPIRAFIAGTGQQGTDAAPKLPQNCALLVRKNTSQGGRRNQGRMFIPNVLNEDTVNATGNIVGAIITDYQDAAASMFGILNDGVPTELDPMPMVILHSEGISDAGEPTVVTSLGVDTVISTQRRRLR